MSTTINSLKEKCEASGLSIHELFRRAGVPKDTIQNWKKEPKTFQTLAKLNDTLKAMQDEVHAGTEVQENTAE